MNLMVNSPTNLINIRRTKVHRIGLGLSAVLICLVVYLRVVRFPQRPDYRSFSLSRMQAEAQKSPDDGRLHYAIGERLRLLGQFQPAYESFAKAAQLDVDDEDSWIATASLAQQLYGDQGAFDLLHLFVQRHPRAGRTHLALAQLYQDNQSHARAYEEACAASQSLPGNAEAWRIRAIEALALQHIPDAEASLRKAIACAPGDWRNTTSLADVFMESRRLDEAIPLYRQAVNLAPSEGLVYAALGRSLLEKARSKEQIEEARQALVRAVSLRPDIPITYFLLGRAEMRAGRWQEARKSLEVAQKLDPNNAEVAFALMNVDGHVGDSAAAAAQGKRHREILDYHARKKMIEEQITQARGDTKPMRLNLARMCVDHGDFKLAVQQYRFMLVHGEKFPALAQELAGAQAALARQTGAAPLLPLDRGSQPSPVIVLQQDADDLFKQGRIPDAESAYLSILEQDPRSAQANERLGLCLMARNDTARAIPLLQRAVTSDPKRVKAQVALAGLYDQAGFPEAARRSMEAAVLVKPTVADYWWKLGAVYAEADSTYSEAEAAYRRAVALDPHNITCLMDLADQLGKRQKYDEAASYYRQALAIAPDNPAVKSRFGMFLVLGPPSHDRASDAERLLKAALKAKPDEYYAMFALGNLYLELHKPKLALSYLGPVLAHSAQSDDTAGVWYSVSRAYRMLGDRARADKAMEISDHGRKDFLDLQHTMELANMDRKNASLRLKLARMNAARGQNARAIRQYQDCLGLAPKNGAARSELNALVLRLKKEGHLPAMDAFNAMAAVAHRP